MAFATWKTPEVTMDGVTYSIVYLPHERIRLRVTGTGEIPGMDQYRPWADFHYSLDEIWIGEGITKIGKKAFAGNQLLKKVWLPETLVCIGEKAFERCPNMDIIVYGSTPESLALVDFSPGAIPDWFDLVGDGNGL